jgi:hypothetical protein
VYVPLAILVYTENGLKEWHICSKFCFKLWKNAIEAFEMLEVAFGEQTVGRTQVFEW